MSEATNNPGQIFRETREKLGLSINDVTVATKINPRILKALEAGEKDKLPAQSFTRGFIKSYAAYLKIEAQPILDGFQFHAHVTPLPGLQNELPESNAVDGQPTIDNLQNPENKKNASSFKITADPTLMSKIYISAALVVLVLVIFAVKRVVDKYSQERLVEAPAVKVEDTPTATSEVAENQETESIPEDATPVPDTSVEVAKPVAAEPPAKADTSPAPAEKVTEKVVEKATEKMADKAATLPTEKTPEKVVNKPAEPALPVKTPPVTATPQEVLIEALDKVDITISVDGGETKKLTLKPEGMHSIRAKKSVQLNIQDGGMVNIIHNGRDKGVPGDLGKPLQLNYP